MQNETQERNSGIKLSLLLTWLFAFAFLNVIGSDNDDANLNFDNPKMVALMYVLQVFSVIALFVVPAILFAAYWTKQKIHYLGITTKPALATLIIASIGILLALPLINWFAEINQQLQLPAAFSGIETWMKNSEATAGELTTVFTRGTTIGSLLLNLFVVAFMAAFSEELFFRGVLQKVLIECFKNKHIAVWTGAILFSAFHMQFYGFLPRMLMGAYLGYLFLWSGSIWPGIVAHFTNNGVAVFLVWLSNRGTIAADVDKIGVDAHEWIYVLTSTLVVCTGLLLIYRIEKRKNRFV
jgi:uncharacterized protein